jgi:phosphatidylinositol alpha 1,6-mannosyltransferase
MRVAYFNANLKKGQDGVTRVMYKMFDGAQERGAEIIAITSQLPEPDDVDFPVYRVPSVPLPVQKAYRLALPGFQAFSETLRAFRPDILHINSPCTLGFGALKYAQHHRVPIVATYHTHFPTYPRYYNLAPLEDMTWRLTRFLYNSMDATFVPTKPILKELSEHNVERLMYLPNGVDTGLFSPERRSLEWRKRFGGGDKPIVLFVSRLVWEKDLRVLAEAYRTLRSQRGDFEMVVVGDGHARKEFEQLMPGAHFLGYQSGVPLAESYASADVFVFPSTTETFGLVTLEAMASGLVPVAANVGGAVEIIEDRRSGILVKPHRGDDLAGNVAWLLDRPQVRDAMKIQAHSRAQRYRWDGILDSLFHMYDQVVTHHRARKDPLAA